MRRNREPASVKKTSRVRSFRGCETCRSRHIKCDEARPTCLKCADAGVECQGYNRQIFFNPKDNDQQARHRQLLFTDDERELFNSSMLQVVPLDRASVALSTIEEWCKEATYDTQTDFFRGPFGAFKLRLDKNDVPNSPSRADTFNLSAFELFNWEESLSQIPHASTNPLCDNLTSDAVPLPTYSVTSSQLTKDRIWQATIHHAPRLLKHYADILIPMMTPIGHQKTPWHIMFLPSAKTTLANITIGQKVDAADLTTYFGTLALSAISLKHHSRDQALSDSAQEFESHAYRYLQDTLEHTLDIPKRYKYKAIVMAILTMVQVSMANGSWDQTDNLLIEAEKFIRLRGLSRPQKSRKVRILHHCYAYARIFHESLSMTSSRSPLQLELISAWQSSGIVTTGSDTPFFCLGAWDNLEQKFQELKAKDVGENDLHLASPGIWEATLYTEIFAVPETWLTLLSQIIRLANEKELSETLETPILSLKEFTNRAKALERYIARRAELVDIGKIREEVQVADRTQLTQLMQNVLYCALMIYFYRRIYDVDPKLLESRVSLVREYLIACKRLCHSDGIFDALMWPAFISGCEALDSESQEFYMTWFDSSKAYGKYSTYMRMKQLMRQVWEHRKQDQNRPINWLQLVSSSSCYELDESQ